MVERSASGANPCGFFDLDELAAFHVVHVAVDGDGSGDQWVVAYALDIVDDGLLPVGDGEELDVLRGARAGAFADILEAFGRESRGFERVGKETTDDVVSEELHAAVGVMDDEEFPGAEELVTDDERTNGVVGGAATLRSIEQDSQVGCQGSREIVDRAVFDERC